MGLTLLTVDVDAQTRIAFASDRNGHVHPRLGWPTFEIYVMEVDGNNQRRLTNNPNLDTHPSWSPDGKRIVFTSERDGNSEIYVMDADGGNQRRLTENPKNDQFPSWSPDGERIAFMSDREGNFLHFDIYVMDADGGNQQNITNNPFDERYPSWSPDGERIAFSSRREGNFENKFGITDEIYVMDADGKNTRRLTNNRKTDSSPSWSPDGKRVVFSSDRDGNRENYEIYVMDADGANPQRLTNNDFYDAHPSWSPDGKRIVFSSDRDGHFIGEFGITSEIYVMDADGKNTRRLTNNRKRDSFPSWSPDGKWIAFASDRKGDDVNYEIYVMDADGGNQRRLTNNRVDDTSPSWSPDGKRIVFTSDKKGNHENYEIYVMDNDGGNQQNLTNHPHLDTNPEWLNSPFSVSPAGKKFTTWGWLKQVDR